MSASRTTVLCYTDFFRDELTYRVYICFTINIIFLHIGSIFLGKIEYYTFKTVAIETELLVFYGNEYFTELGYLVEEDEPEIGKFYFHISFLCEN